MAKATAEAGVSAGASGRARRREKSTTELFTMMQVCREADMTYQTLKFYCNQGLVPNVKRDKNNRRVFDRHDVEWVKSLVCLKKCGMSIEEMREYLALCLQGKRSIPERKVMLAEKRARLIEQIAELEGSVDYIDWKQGFYDDVLAGRTEYVSNLLPSDEASA
ncbi:MAG: MerR family transcriptional regulator [Eggerthellaceae bacterium]|nr:MerR family transcriptional regulator [Eggerthellaceae bacterium]